MSASRFQASAASMLVAAFVLAPCSVAAATYTTVGDSIFAGVATVHKINFVFPQAWNGEPGDTAAWTGVRNTLRSNKEPEIYFPAKLEINCNATRSNPECVLMDSVGVRYKGNSTFSSTREKNPFRVSFDEYGIDQRWNGVKGFTLNNANMDPSHMAEKIHMDFAVTRAGMPGPRFAYADVYVNGFPYSFYLLGELADKRLLDKYFDDKDGDLFKAIDGLSNNSDFTTASFTNKRYENKSDSVERGWTRLGQVIEAVNGSNAAVEMPARINLNSVYRGLGTDILFGSTDSYLGAGQNYLVYFPEADGSKMEWILWDASLSFGLINLGPGGFGGGGWGGGGGGTSTNCSNSATSSIVCSPSARPLGHKIMNTESLKQDYLRALWFLYKAYYEGSWVTARIDSVAAIIRPYVEADPHRLGVSSMSAFDNAVNSLKSFITNRQNSVATQFTAQGITAETAIRAGDVVLNEIAPAQGWVEVYNARDYAIDLSGHALSDDPSQPGKWAFPAASFVPPRGHLVVRLQGGAIGAYGPATFALPSSGGHLRLSRAGGSVVDSVTFGPRGGDSTVARSADGGGVFVQGFPTPGAANVAAVDAPASIAPLAVVINEFMADNDTITAPVGVNADWVELYNNTSASVSLAGMYLSDNATNPAKWTFPAGASIAANGYLVVWAYDTTFAGSLHASWALSKDGEHIRLSNADSSVVDSVTFGPQVNNRTTARVPNGTGPFVANRLPTLGAHNGDTVTALVARAGAPAGAELRLTGTVARIRLAQAGPVTLTLMDARGREVAILLRARLQAGEHPVTLDPGRLPAGAYLLRLRAGGTTVVRHAVVLR